MRQVSERGPFLPARLRLGSYPGYPTCNSTYWIGPTLRARLAVGDTDAMAIRQPAAGLRQPLRCAVEQRLMLRLQASCARSVPSLATWPRCLYSYNYAHGMSSSVRNAMRCRRPL